MMQDAFVNSPAISEEDYVSQSGSFDGDLSEETPLNMLYTDTDDEVLSDLPFEGYQILEGVVSASTPSFGFLFKLTNTHRLHTNMLQAISRFRCHVVPCFLGFDSPLSEQANTQVETGVIYYLYSCRLVLSHLEWVSTTSGGLF
jgi:hypothetical protein